MNLQFRVGIVLPGDRQYRLFDKERQNDQRYKKESRQCANTRKVALDMGVIGVELIAACCGCNIYGYSCSSVFLGHWILLVL